jgi:hypothetical protein
LQEAPAVGVQVQQVKKRVLKVTDVAGEIVAELVKQRKHQVTIFTRKVNAWNTNHSAR